MNKQAVIDKLNEAFLPQNIECDGSHCMGCWKDVVREAIKMLQEESSEEDRHKKSLEFLDKYLKENPDEVKKFNQLVEKGLITHRQEE